VPDQLLMYDTAVANWVTSEFSTLVSAKNFYLMVGTADRAFAEYVTPTGIDPDGRPPLPRAAITIGDPEENPEWHTPGKIRLLGYSDTDDRLIRNAEYPVPFLLPYTLNFWSEYKREMNLYVQQILKLFRYQYTYISVDVDSISPEPVYGTKDIGLYADGGVVKTGDLEPGNQERILRRTFAFHAKAWLWDFDFGESYSVKDFELQSYQDENLTLLFEIARTPQRHKLFEGDGGTTVFSGSTDPNFLPIVQRTFLLDATVGASNVRGFDDGSGSIVGTGITSGTVDYNTGAVSVTYDSPPDDDTDITVGYYTTTS